MVENIIIQGLTNRVSGHLGQPESGSGQPELAIWLPGGQPRFLTVFLLNISNVSSITLKQQIFIQIYTLQNVLLSIKHPGQQPFRAGS